MINVKLTTDSPSPTTSVKKFIILHKLIKYQCSLCSIVDSHNGKPLVLHLDHINGIRTDNRLENLRFLCPNCHSQTDTYCGKNKGKNSKVCACGSTKYYYANFCKECNRKLRLTNQSKKIDWPDIEFLLKRSKEVGYSSLSRELGVTDNAVRKHIRKRI